MYANKTRSLAILCALLLAASSTGAASAITGNYQQDKTHSCVGLAVYYELNTDGKRVPIQVSSAILISPRIALTAAHPMITESVAICFDSGPITWKVQNDEIILEGATHIYTGTAFPNPQFKVNLQGKNGLPATDYRDIGIIVLDQDVPTDIVKEYGILPTAGLVDNLKPNTQVTLVGYGMQEHLTPRKAGVENTWTGILMRTNASAKILSGNFAWSNEFLRCSANPGQGKGGISYGDSGGPVFLGDSNIVLAVNSYVTNPNCVGQTYHSRVDLPEILSWITGGDYT